MTKTANKQPALPSEPVGNYAAVIDIWHKPDADRPQQTCNTLTLHSMSTAQLAQFLKVALTYAGTKQASTEHPYTLY